MQPSLFPTLSYDHAVDPFFRSVRRQAAPDARRDLRRRVVADGVLAAGRRLDPLLRRHAPVRADASRQNKLKDTLPQALERCGYRNVVFYPMMRNFVSNDRFYNSIGLQGDLRHEDPGRQDAPRSATASTSTTP